MITSTQLQGEDGRVSGFSSFFEEQYIAEIRIFYDLDLIPDLLSLV